MSSSDDEKVLVLKKETRSTASGSGTATEGGERVRVSEVDEVNCVVDSVAVAGVVKEAVYAASEVAIKLVGVGDVVEVRGVRRLLPPLEWVERIRACRRAVRSHSKS